MSGAGESPPDGFVPSRYRGPFSTRNGPYYHRPCEEGAQHAFHASDNHCNAVGLVHGGMLSAFLDGLLAAAVHRATDASPVTMHLSVDFLDMGRSGDWVQGEARVTRATRDVAFVEGRAHVAGRDLARASGLFKLMKRRPD